MLSRCTARSLVVMLLLVVAVARGQAPTFEVATVKRVDNSTLGDSISMNIGTIQGGQVTFGNATLGDCIRFAYDVTSDAQIAGPDWIKSKQYLYNLTAKGMPGATEAQLKQMLQALLAERFGLAVHVQPRPMPYFALTVAKRGAQMQSVPAKPAGFQGRTWGGQIDSIITMSTLAYLLSRFDTERPTIDQTGLAGPYQVKLTWTIASRRDNAQDAGPPLSTAIQEQLGLKLEERKGPVNVWVVDKALQMPTEN